MLTARFPFNQSYFLVYLLFFFPLFRAEAQHQSLRIGRYSVENGLSQNSVLDILQDRQGFLWLATQDGLNRFDGYKFHILRSDLKARVNISDNHVRALYQDKNLNLWIGTFGGGITVLPSDGSKPVKYEKSDDPGSLSDQFILKFVSDSKDNLWILTRDNGINRWNPETRNFSRFLFSGDPALKGLSPRLTDLLAMPDGKILVGTESDGTLVFTPESGNVRFLDPDDSRRNNHPQTVNSLFSPDKNTVWVGTDAGLKILSYPAFKSLQVPGVLKTAQFATARISRIFKDSRSVIWIGTNGQGLFRIPPDYSSLVRFQGNQNRQEDLSDNNIRSIFEDHAGNIWIGTYSGGLNKINERSRLFDHFKDNIGLNNSVVSLFEHPVTGEIFAGTFGDGLLIFDPEKNTVQRLHADSSPVKSGYEEVMAIRPLDNRYLLIGTYNGVYVLDLNSRKFLPAGKFWGFADPFNGQKIRAIARDKKGVFWIASLGSGLFSLDPVSRRVVNYSASDLSPVKLPSNDAVSLLADSKGWIWIGTYGAGLIRLNPESKKIVHFIPQKSDTLSLSSNFVLGMEEDNSGKIWIGTRDGLNLFEEQTRRFHHFHELNGLSNNIVYAVSADSRQQIWASTNNGITLLHQTAEGKWNLRSFDQSDGLQSNEFNTGAVYKSSNGFFYFGGINGVNRFLPDSISEIKNPPLLALTSVQVGTSALPFSFAPITRIDLPAGVPDFNIEYAALEFINPVRNLYSYRLKGFDKGWIDAGTRRFASYTNLPPGGYEFQVKATNYAGVPSDSILTIQVSAETPWWRTWVAFVLYFLLTGLVVWLLVRARSKKLAAENKILEERIRAKTQELMSRTDELESSYAQLRLSQSYLVQSEKMASLGTLVAGVAHEINNPVNFITSSIEPLRQDVTDIQNLLAGYTELIRIAGGLARSESEESGEKIREIIHQLEALSSPADFADLCAEIDVLLKGIESGTQRTSEIVKSLRNFSRMDDKDKKLFDIHESLDTTIRILSKEFEKYKIELIRNYSDIGLVDCYPGQLSQVFMNLLMNAVQALEDRPDGRVEISTNKVDNTVLITIQDNGPGISPEIQNRIFDPFFTTKDVGKGTGMGLSITYSIIQKHNGTIQVLSEPGQGTGFIISLPATGT